jgi:hypothetical protein
MKRRVFLALLYGALWPWPKPPPPITITKVYFPPTMFVLRPRASSSLDQESWELEPVSSWQGAE